MSIDGGQSFTDTGWYMADTGSEGSPDVIAFASPSGTLYLGVDYFGVLSSNDGGHSFTQLSAFPGNIAYNAFYATESSIYAVLFNNNASNPQSQLAVWTGSGPLVGGTTVNEWLADIAVLNETIFIAGNFGTLQATVDNGKTFTQVTFPGVVESLSVNNGTLYLNGGTAFSKDGEIPFRSSPEPTRTASTSGRILSSRTATSTTCRWATRLGR